MEHVARKLRELVASVRPRLSSLAEEHVSEKHDADKWSLKEVLGHLIDSASTNHQRFVRMQLQRDIGAFSYQQVQWNAAQRYQVERWSDLVELWASYNMHLAHVIEHVEPGTLENTCDMGYPSRASLRFVMEDYVRHVEHHLEQILSGVSPQERRKWQRRDPKE